MNFIGWLLIYTRLYLFLTWNMAITVKWCETWYEGLQQYQQKHLAEAQDLCMYLLSNSIPPSLASWLQKLFAHVHDRTIPTF
jgi:hypothetical protein